MDSVESYRQQLQGFVRADFNDCTVYQRNISATLQQALIANFRATKQLLGEDDFLPLAYTYANHYASRHWDINLYGDGFAAFIAAQVNGGKKGQDWLLFASIAALEYEILVLYYADDSKNAGVTDCYRELTQADRLGIAAGLKAVHPYASFPATSVAKNVDSFQLSRQLSPSSFSITVVANEVK